MVKITWSETSIDNIVEIVAYISKDSVRYAERMAARIFQRVQVLETHPLSGRIVPEISDQNIRELIEGNYRIIYEILSESEVLILTVHLSAKKL